MDDDFSMGVLQSAVHETWARATGTQLREAESGFRYTPTTCFERFPFPHATSRQQQAIAEAAKALDDLRRGWLLPAGADEDELKRRTLTSLYNEPPSWLRMAHTRLDEAVHAAYGWSYPLEPDEVLQRLVTLNFDQTAALAA